MMVTAPKDKLIEFAAEVAAFVETERQLHRRRPFPPTISFELADWFLDGVAAFSTGKESDFGKALGLKRGRGKPKAEKPSGKNYDRAKQIFWMRGTAKKPLKSWTQIANEFPGADVRDLQRELVRYTPDIIADFAQEFAARMKVARPWD